VTQAEARGATPEEDPTGWLIVHALNTAGTQFDDPALDERCCSNCCGACAALVALRDAGTLDDRVRLVAQGGGWSWWVDGRVDREYLDRAIRPDCETCRD
jgi:hypothetical protein